VDVAYASERGILGGVPSDAHLVETVAPGVTLVAVADGFGEVGRGNATAPLALATVCEYVRRRHRVGSFDRYGSPSGLRSLLLAALDHANTRLYAQSGSHEDHVASGTSLTAVLMVGAHAFVGHVGDARAYLARLGNFDMLTADDAMFSGAAVASAKSPTIAKRRARGVLWRSLGTQAKLEASIAHVELLAGDRLLLCTDGVHRCLDDAELHDALRDDDAAGTVVTRLLTTLRLRGNVDHATLLVARDVLAPTFPNVTLTARIRPLRVALALITMLALFCGGALAVRTGLTDRPSHSAQR